MVGGVESYDLSGAFQPKAFYDFMKYMKELDTVLCIRLRGSKKGLYSQMRKMLVLFQQSTHLSYYKIFWK